MTHYVSAYVIILTSPMSKIFDRNVFIRNCPVMILISYNLAKLLEK